MVLDASVTTTPPHHHTTQFIPADPLPRLHPHVARHQVWQWSSIALSLFIAPRRLQKLWMATAKRWIHWLLLLFYQPFLPILENGISSQQSSKPQGILPFSQHRPGKKSSIYSPSPTYCQGSRTEAADRSPEWQDGDRIFPWFHVNLAILGLQVMFQAPKNHMKMFFLGLLLSKHFFNCTPGLPRAFSSGLDDFLLRQNAFPSFCRVAGVWRHQKRGRCSVWRSLSNPDRGLWHLWKVGTSSGLMGETKWPKSGKTAVFFLCETCQAVHIIRAMGHFTLPCSSQQNGRCTQLSNKVPIFMAWSVSINSP